MTAESVTDLIPSVSIAALLARRDALQAALQRVWDAVDEGQRLAATAGFGSLDDVIRKANFRGYSDSLRDQRLREHASRRIDAEAWAYLLDQTGLRSFFDSKAKEEWRDAIEKLTTPPLTAENIEATFAGLYEQRHEIMERGILATFRRLSWSYKTNSPVAFGKRIIVTGVTHDNGRYTHHFGCDSLDDLVRALAYVDGKPEPDHRTAIRCQIDRVLRDEQPRLELDYFELRLFKNGNAHVIFNTPALVEKLNGILRKHYPNALPPTRDGR